MRRDAKADANQPEIVEELRALGYKVAHTYQLGRGLPDIIVGGYNHRCGHNTLLWVEIKTDGGCLTEHEKEFHDEWYDYPVITATNAEQVLQWFGAKEVGCEPE